MIFQDSYQRIHGPAVLVAEKDDGIRDALAHRLRTEGFGVLEARSSMEALLVATEFEGDIRALVTSPEIRKFCNGPGLASCLRLTHPGLEICYMGNPGEIGEEVARDLARGEAVLIRKPLTEADLDRAVSLLEERVAQPAWKTDADEWTR